MPRFEISSSYLKQVLEDLLNTPSPTGDTDWAISFIQAELDNLGIHSSKTTKGALIAYFEGLRNDRPRAISAHVDTLGLMVKEIKPNGRLKMSALNGIVWPAIESEGVTISTRSGTQVRGSIVFENGAVHVNGKVKTDPRDENTLEIRIDERTSSAEETRLLGIEIGNFVYLDPRFEASTSGFIRSRFLDDKASVAAILAALKAMHDAGVSPSQRTHVLFSNFEEVGHGGADSVPEDVLEMLVVDMACVGVGQNGDEFHCSICLKDSNGPYSKDMSSRILNLADRAGIELRTDVYPHYGSDGGAYWFAGGKAQVALIGPGVDNSHCYERTHMDAIKDTAGIIAEYLIGD